MKPGLLMLLIFTALNCLTMLLFTSVKSFAHGTRPRIIARCANTCTKEEIEKSIPAAIGSLALAGKIESRWTEGKVENVEFKQFAKSKEWVAVINDPKPKSLRKLYIFITAKGYLNGSNYTGN